MLARIAKFVGLAALAAIAPLASSQTQATRSQSIRAGVVILENSKDPAAFGGQPMSAGPHAWFNLHSDRIVKPVAWNLYNPNASSILTQEMHDRWSLIDPSGTPPVGTRLTKQHAVYWEVFLNKISDSALADYDVLLLNPANYASLAPGERERLRRFVDQGGLLWIDGGGLRPNANGVDLINNFPYAFRVTPGPVNGEDRYDPSQPLLTSPNPLSSSDVNLLNNSIDPSFPTALTLASIDLGADAGLQTYVGAVTAEFFRMQTAVAVNNRPTISIGRIGDGMLVATSRGVSLKLNRPYGFNTTSNVGFLGRDPVLDRDGIAAAKLTVNMINLLTEFRQSSGGSRKAGSSPIDVGAPPLRRSSGEAIIDTAPTIYKGMVVAVVDNRIVVYDANPYRDLDGDGNPDDGLQDLSGGAVEDVIWASAPLANGPLSTPVCAEVPDATGIAPVDQVLVMDSRGTLHAYNMIVRQQGAFVSTGDQAFNRPTSYSAALSAVPSNSGVPFAPTVYEGFAYVTDVMSGSPVRGRIWVVDLSVGDEMKSSGRDWVIGGGGSSPVQLPEFTASSTIGTIPIADNSGGVDRVLYAPFAPSTAGVPSAGFISIWLGARGEKPTDYEPKPGDVGSALIVTTRAQQQGGLPIYIPASPSPLGVKLSLLDDQGRVMSLRGRPGEFGGIGMNALFSSAAQPVDLGGGVLSFPFRPGVTSLPSQVAGIRIDYSIDWGTGIPGVLASIERGRINLPDRGNLGPRRVQGPVALSPGGTIWLTTQQPGGGGVNRGGIYSFKEEGRGLFKMTTRFEMYRSHQINRNGGERVPYGSVLYDNDPFRLMMYERSGGSIKFGGELTTFRVVGPPVIRNGQTFVAVGATEGATIPGLGTIPAEATVLLAFRAEPEVPQVQIGELPNNSIIMQPDVARSANPDVPEVPSTLAGANYSYDRRSGRIRFDNLATIQKGPIQNSISLSQPILIRRPGQPDELVEPDSRPGSRWTPVLWYSVFQGLDVTGSTNPLVATGDTIFIAGRSRTPRFLAGAGFAPVGMVHAIRTDVSSGNPFLLSIDPNADTATRPAMQKLWPTPPYRRPWMNQFTQFRITANNTSPTGNSEFAANPGFLWPQLRGVDSLEDYIVRLNQATLTGPGGSSQVALGVIAGDGALVTWGDAGIYTFSRTDFQVADESRIAQFDPAGNLLRSMSASGSTGFAGSSSGNVVPLVRPTRAYRTNNGGTLMVDTGANRIALINPAGVEERSISQFQLDPNITPNGYTANEPLTLNAPRDVLTYTSIGRRPTLDGFVTPGDGIGPNGYEYWVHYLIADSGNRRLIEIVDRFVYQPSTGRVLGPVTVTGSDGTPRSQVGVLVWHSPASVSGKDFSYNSISRVWVGDINTGRNVYVAGIGGSLPTRVDVGLDSNPGASASGIRQSRDGNGGVVIFDPQSPTGTYVINRLRMPAFAPNVFWNDSTGAFDSPAIPAGERLLGNVSAVTARPVYVSSGVAAMAIMIADGSGVYEVLYDGTATDALPVRWMLPNQAYRVLRRNGAGIPIGSNVPLRATYARRLDNGDVLVVNGFYGPRRDGKNVGGEILQLVGTPNAPATVTTPNLGFGLLSITFELPPVEGSRGLVLPVFADRK